MGIHHMKHKIRLRDIIGAQESTAGGIRGEVIFGRGKKQIPFMDADGLVKYRTEFEEVLYRDENIVPIGGYQFTFNKLFNIGLDKRSTLSVGDLNDEAPQMKIGAQRPYDSPSYTAEVAPDTNNPQIGGINISANNFIFGFMVGDGGAREDNITAIAPDYKRRTLFRAIPFRMIGQEHDNTDMHMPVGKYFGAFTNNAGVSSFYVKRFDANPTIIHAWHSNNRNQLSIVDDTVFASTSSIPIDSYVEIQMSINMDDCRQFFQTEGVIPRINEFGLVSGWYNHRAPSPFNTSIHFSETKQGDYESIRLFTHFTRPSIALAEGDEIEALYRLYAR